MMAPTRARQPPRMLRLMLTNAFGILSKLGEFQASLNAHHSDIVIVTETKVTEDKATPADLTFPGYFPPVRRDRTAQGGGIAIWIRTDLAFTELECIDTGGNEILWVRLKTAAGPSIGVCAVYRSGSSADGDISALNSISSGIDDARQCCQNIIVAGDLNVHNREWLGSSGTSPAGEAAEDLCYHHCLDQHVHEPTRGNNILDLIKSDIPGSVISTLHPPLGKSDHAVVVTDFEVAPSCDRPSKRTVWRYQHADWPRLRAFFRSTNWVLTDDNSIDVSCVKLTQKIKEGMQIFIPSKTLKLRQGDPAWWSPECQEAVDRKQRAWRRHRSSPNNAHLRLAYSMATGEAANCLHRAKQAHTTSIRRKIREGALSSRQWWTTVKRAGGQGHRSADIPVLRASNGTEHTTCSEKAEAFGQYFSAKCSLGDNDLQANSLPPVRPRSQAQLRNVHFRPSTVERKLRQLHPAKATGPDGIPGRVLRQCSKELAVPVSRLFSQPFHQGRQPTMWKTAMVVPVHKKKSKSDVKNYRPISLFSILSKVMEAIINHSIRQFLEAHNILSKSQYGFRSQLGTQDVLTLLNYQWSRVAARGGVVRVIAVDVAGAFDRVSHVGVLHKAQCYGVTGPLLAWLRDYLTDRHLRVAVGGELSCPYPTKAGVPQGSILGPTLFILYTNDGEDHLPPGMELAAYADDTTLFHCLTSRADIDCGSELLQQGIDAFSRWGHKWRIKFEPSKTQAMSIGHHRQPWELPRATFDGTPVSEESRLKLLGVTFDDTLSYSFHLRSLASRANQRIGFLKRASPILDAESRQRVYNGFVRPTLEYCPLVWMSSPSSHLKKLDQIQRRALHIIGAGTWLPSLALRRLVAALAYTYKLCYLDASSPLKQMLPKPATHRAPETRPTRQSLQLHRHSSG